MEMINFLNQVSQGELYVHFLNTIELMTCGIDDMQFRNA